MAFQAPVAFHDVVASFTVEQWMRMESWKKELYQNVVKEIHKTLLRLGYTIINPEVLFNIQKSDESCVRIDHSSAEREHKVIGDVPDLLLRVKEENEEEAHCSSEKPKIKDEKETSLLPKPSCPVISSVASLNVKEEQMVCEFGDATEPRQTNNQDGNQLFIKQEEEVYLIDDYNTVGLETTVQDTPNPTATIKQEMDNRDHPFFPDIIPVVVKEECDPMEDVATGHHSTAVVATTRHHPSSFDSDEERRRLVAILLEKRRNRPIPFIDILAWDPIKKPNDLEPPRPPQVRAGHVRWCVCGHCMPLETDEESICCQEIMNVRKMLSFGMCICEVEYLRDDLVSREHLIALHRYHLSYKKRRFPGAEGFFDRNYRIIAYRAFTMWVHGYLGQNHKRRPIPACVVKRIGDRFSAADEMPWGYTYEASRDCNAALLLDCDI